MLPPINYIHLDSVDSTNSWVKREAQRLDPLSLTCVSAEEQTAGRGRFERKWLSPKGENIHASFFFILKNPQDKLEHLAQLLSLSCAKVLIQRGFHPTFKWPNDLLLNGKKVAGVLAETIFIDNRVGVIEGIGLNVNMGEEFLEKIDQPATSLFLETGKRFPLTELLQEISLQFYADLSIFQEKGFGPFLSLFQRLGVTKS
jgi:BirA family biotin operon repressor/biotin-[acetyl-CoA-carboxylase] ligase